MLLLEEALAFARMSCPSVICERLPQGDGSSELREIIRHDWLYDPERDEWRYLMARTSPRYAVL